MNQTKTRFGGFFVAYYLKAFDALWDWVKAHEPQYNGGAA